MENTLRKKNALLNCLKKQNHFLNNLIAVKQTCAIASSKRTGKKYQEFWKKFSQNGLNGNMRLCEVKIFNAYWLSPTNAHRAVRSAHCFLKG